MLLIIRLTLQLCAQNTSKTNGEKIKNLSVNSVYKTDDRRKKNFHQSNILLLLSKKLLLNSLLEMLRHLVIVKKANKKNTYSYQGGIICRE